VHHLKARDTTATFQRCWTRINGLAGFGQVEQTAIFLREFSGDRTVRRGLDQHDHRTSRHLTASCGGFFKERFCGNNPKIQEELNITEKKLMKALTNKFFKKLQDTTKGVNACVKEGRRHVHCLLSLHVSTF